ncbi:MAG: hypothetical protein DMG25_13890 [Acidobacteria bacterium]|nr:MAG: hypothetical protein DMG25_13890 [Acidobacteriota bacterium]
MAGAGPGPPDQQGRLGAGTQTPERGWAARSAFTGCPPNRARRAWRAGHGARQTKPWRRYRCAPGGHCDRHRGEGSKELGQKIRQTIGPNHSQVVVNLGNVTSIDSAALGELVAAVKAVQDEGGQVRLSDVSPEVLRAFRAANLHHFFEIHRHEADALASFDQPGASGG